MHKFLSLTRVSFKNTMGMLADGKTKKTRTVALYIFIGIALLPTIFAIYAGLSYTVEMLAPLNQVGTVLALGFHGASIVTFLFSIFLIPSVFYFSKDSDILLALPLKPQTILSSKFMVCLAYEYLFELLILIPLLLAYASHMEVSALFILFSILIIITLPIYPLVLSSLITMLIMRFVPFFKNRDRFNMIAGALTILLAFGFSFAMSNMSTNMDENTMLALLISGNNSLIRLFSYLFPGIPFAANALIDFAILDLLIYLLIVIASFVVFLFFGKYFYFKGVIGFSETGSNRKQLSTSAMDKASKKRSAVWTYTMKEYRLILRTPVYCINCIGTIVIIPIMFAIIYFSGDLGTITAQLPTNIVNQLPQYLPYAGMLGFALGIFLSNINSICSTAISREGNNAYIMKYIPMALGKQIEAKLLCGILVSTASLVICILGLYIVAPFLPVSFFLLSFVCALISIFFGNMLAIILDMSHPKLVWEQEAAAVKQNMTSIIGVIGSMLVAGLIVFICFKIPSSAMALCVGIIGIVFILICGILYLKLNAIAVYFFKKI